jgi:hypothetical protein
MAVTAKKIEANRRNAQKSTGPKTADGKAVSKLNALKHGLLAQTVVVRGHKLQESNHEFKKLCQEFYADLNPVGPLEEMLLGQIVTASWRLRRARTAESGEIALSVDGGWWTRRRQNPLLESMEWDIFGDPVHAMRDSALGNRLMESQLKAVRASVDKTGELTEDAIQSVIFHGKPYSLTTDLEGLRSRLQQNPEGLEPSALRAKQKEQALAYLDRKLRHISWGKSNCEEREEMEEEMRQAAAVLPSEETLDKILRYEAALERQLFRAMNQLERLQRRRQGENIPAPLTMDISAKA